MSYWYDDYSYCDDCDKIEPTDANKIEDDAINNFRNYLHKCFSNEYEELKQFKEKMSSFEKTLLKKEEELKERERKIKESECNFEKKLEEERLIATEKAETALRDKFFGKYAPGTKVYFYKLIEEKGACPICGDSGEIEVTYTDNQGKQHTVMQRCPRCHGDYGKNSTTLSYKYKIREGVIDEVRATIKSNSCNIITVMSDSFMREDFNPYIKVLYTIDNNNRIETDVRGFYSDGLHQLFFDKNLCKEEAEKAVLDKNKELSEKWENYSA